MLKKLVASFIIVISLFGFLSCEIFLKIKQLQIQATVLRQTQLHLPKSQLHHFFMKKAKASGSLDEFEYHGEMYDVVSSDTVGDIVNYYCFKDKEENALLPRLKKIVENHMANRHRHMEKIFKNWFDNFICNAPAFKKTWSPNFNSDSRIGVLKNKPSCLYEFVFICKIKQPPENFAG